MPNSLQPQDCSMPGFLSFIISQNLLRLMSIESMMPSNQLILCCPLLHLIRVFSSELDLCIRWPKYWSFSFSSSPSNEYSALISFRVECFDFLVVWGTLKSLLQHPSSKTSILQYSAFFIVQLSHPYIGIRKTKLWLHRHLLAKLHLCFLICSIFMPIFLLFF